MPTVIIGHDMPPELAADVSTALAGDGRRRQGQRLRHPRRGTEQGHRRDLAQGRLGQDRGLLQPRRRPRPAHPGRVVAVDLDVQFGDLGTALALTPEHTLAQLARASQIDATTVKLFLTRYEHGLYVLCRRQRSGGRRLDRPRRTCRAVLPLLAQNFDYVVVDTPAGLDERTLAAIECATDLLLVSSLDVTSIRSLRKALDALDQHRRHGGRGTSSSTGPTPRSGSIRADAEEAIGMTHRRARSRRAGRSRCR